MKHRFPTAILIILGFVSLGCAAGQGGRTASGPARACMCACPCKGGPDGVPAAEDHGQAAVPVTAADPTWGSPDAPVTIVLWSDFECPFCSRVGETLEQLKRAYGPERLRLVWKNLPLAFHAHARPAAEAAMTVFALGGSTAFWKFHDLVFANQRRLSPENLVAWAVQAGVARVRFEESLLARRSKAKVDEDMALGGRLDIQGTPVFRINGVLLSGAQPVESFRAIIDGQLATAQDLLAGGIPARGIYPALCNRNVVVAAPLPAVAPGPRPEDTTVYGVTVDRDDPVRGPADALVTLVLWSDFECPFCRRIEATLAKLVQKYGPELRIVWKDFPLPFHRQAVPAAVLARLALGGKGVEGFWRAHDALVEVGDALDEAALKAVAGRLGLAWPEVQKAIADQRFQPVFDREDELAKKLGVRGTPCSFVNGRRIEGAMPVEAFVAVIDAQLAKARDLLEAGKARQGLYAAITNTVEPVDEPERKTVDAPTKDNPTRGSAKAKVTMQIFGDFQCPETLRIVPALAEVEKKFAGKVRLVWRNRPLVFHEDAALAAEAAQEVFAQKGAAAFWRYHGLLFAAQTEGGLGRANLEKLARKLGVDGKRFRAALDTHRHQATIERDIEAARKAEIVEVPAVLINGYLVSGTQPLDAFERVVTRALAEAGHAP